jgi:hypothetical protein
MSSDSRFEAVKPFRISWLILLCHKSVRQISRRQHRHRGSVRALARAVVTGTEVIEFAT